MRRRRKRLCGLAPSRRPLIPHGVIIVDDQDDFLDVAQSILSEDPDLTILGTASNGADAIELVTALSPDFVVLDVQMPGLSGFETARRLLACSPGLRIVMVSSDGEPSYEAFALSAGAEAFLSKKQFLDNGLTSVLTTN